MKSSSKALPIVFTIGVLACLLQIWLPACFLTGDGPCHVYNAQVLHDLWGNKNVPYYDRFYTQVGQPNPNWLANMLLVLLVNVANGIVAEKLLLSLYVVLFCGGFYLLFKKIAGERTLWPLVLLLFVFPHALTKGFYNFSFSLALYPWMVWTWLQYIDARRAKHLAMFAIATVSAYFANLLGFVFGMVTCGALTLSVIASGTGKPKTMELVKLLLILVAIAAPFLILLFRFSEGQGGMQLSFKPHPYRAIELLEFKHLINFSNREVLWGRVAGGLFFLSFCIALLVKPVFRLHRYDGFIAALAVAVFIYLFAADDILNRMMDMSTRTQLFVIVLMACIVQYRSISQKVKNAVGIALLLIFGILSVIRLSIQRTSAEAVTDLLSACDHIAPNSVVLPLYFSIDGLDEQGKVISDRNHSFKHVAQYLGTYKPLIVLDNYEAKTGYFPLIWTKNVDPYTYMGKKAGIEDLPPTADITTYKHTSGVTVDYVLMWCYKSAYQQDPAFRRTYDELQQDYQLVYSSPSGRTLLYKNK